MFSIVIPLYNKANHIRACVESVLAQDYVHHEIIVVDDGSTDDGLRKILKISDDRLRVIRQKNAGVSVARNTGIANAKYNYIALLDADDIWCEGHLSSFYQMITKYPGCPIYATSYFQKKNGKTMQPNFHLDLGEGEVVIVDDLFKVNTLGPNIAWTSALMLNKQMLPLKFFFRPDLRMGEDLDFLLRAADFGEVCFCSKPTAIYDLDAENRSCTKYFIQDVSNYLLTEWFQTYKHNYTFKGQFVRKIQVNLMKNLILHGFGCEVKKIVLDVGLVYFGFKRYTWLYLLAIIPSDFIQFLKKYKFKNLNKKIFFNV